jgi:hypothetical protein
MANFFDKYDEPAKGNVFDKYDEPQKKTAEGFTDRLQKVWDNPTPGGALWLAKQAVSGVKNSVDLAKVATSTPQTEEDQFQIDWAREHLPEATMQAASVMAPGAPKGAGGAFAARMAAPAAPAAPVAAASTAAPAAARENLAPVVQAAQRVSDVTGVDVAVPRAVASDNMAVQRAGQGVRNLPIVGDAIPKATDRLVQGLEDATKSVADQYGGGSGPNVANRIGRTIQDAAELETREAANAARRSDEAVTAAWQRDVDAAHHDVAGRETLALQAARAAVGDMSPQDMGATLIARLRTEEQSARAQKDMLYDRAGTADASVREDAVRNVRSVVAQGLDDAGVVVDRELTPAASRMLDELQRLSELNIPNRAVGARVPATGEETIAGVTVQGIEQARKRLNFFRGAATNDADRRAAGMAMRRFDEWQSQVFENALLSGDDTALAAFREARAANTRWRNRFFNEENDAGRFVTRIVSGEVTPQEVANYIVGAGQVGAKGVSSRLLTEIADATGNDAEAMQAISGAIWNRLSQSTEGTNPKAPAAVTRDVMEFLHGSGRDVAQRLFTPEQQRVMRAYADTLRSGQDARALIGDVAAATRPGSMEVAPGPMKQLADAVIGKGGKSDEALFKAIDGYAKSGNRADVATLAKLVRAIPQQERTNLAGSIIRQIGVSPRTGEFSPDVFVSQWNSYTPQAKAVLFGNAGPHRQAIDDIAAISTRLKEVGSRFGNPSGTAQNTSFTAMGAGLIAAPITTIASVIGGAAAAKFLAAPAGAASTAKWSAAYSRMLLGPTPQHVALFKVASRNLANSAQSLGIKFSPNDLLRAAQGPVPSRAEDKQPEPERVAQ